MTSQPDKLFRDKLENFQRPAPAAAWERIESGLNKKDHKGLWMKIAAGLLLLAVSVFLLWPSASTEHVLPVSNTVAPSNQAIEKSNPEQPAPAVAEQRSVPQKITPRKKTIPQQPAPVLTTTAKVEDAPPVVEEKETTSLTTVAVVETPEEAATTPSRTIVYTAAEVNAKFLRKKSSVEATPEEKKSSGVQKLMGLAYTLKNTDKGIGDLRQKKDEILALNFLSNEDKTNKDKN